MKTQYDTEQWAKGTTRGRHIFNYQFRLFAQEFRGMEMAKTVTMQEDRDVTERVYLWQSKKEPRREVVSVTINESHSWRLAQTQLHLKLQQCMRPSIPRGTGKLAPVGDVNFVGRVPVSNVPASVFFARGNVCVSVNSVGETTIDVSKISLTLDSFLNEPPTKAQLAKKLVRTRKLKVPSQKGKKSVTLIANLRKAAPHGEWLKVIAPGGELDREGDRLTYISTKGRIGIVAMYLMRST